MLPNLALAPPVRDLRRVPLPGGVLSDSKREADERGGLDAARRDPGGDRGGGGGGGGGGGAGDGSARRHTAAQPEGMAGTLIKFTRLLYSIDWSARSARWCPTKARAAFRW